MDLLLAVAVASSKDVIYCSLITCIIHISLTYLPLLSWKTCYPTMDTPDVHLTIHISLPLSLNQIEVEHQKNADVLKNPYPAIEFNEFHKQASTAQMLAEDLSMEQSGIWAGSRLVWNIPSPYQK